MSGLTWIISAMMVSFGPWSIGRRPSAINDQFKSIGGAQDAVAARNNPPETFKNTEHWRTYCDRFMFDAFQVILNFFTIFVICYISKSQFY